MTSSLRALSEAVVASGLSPAVIVVDDDQRVVHAAGGAFTRHGYEPARLTGKPLREILPPDALAQLEPRYRAALAGEHQSFDYWTRDGERAYWVQVSPLRAPGGAVTAVVAVLQDITDRLMTTAELERSEARLRESEWMIGVGSWELWLEDHAVTYSDGFARVTGLTPGEAVDLEAFRELVHPDDRGILAQAIADCLAEGSITCEYRIVRRDGSVRILSIQGESVPGSDVSPAYLRGAVLDVTELRRSEWERLEALSLFQQGFEASPIGMAVTGHDGRYVRINDALCRLLGRTREELLTLTFDQTTHPDDLPRAQAGRQALLEGKISVFEAEKRYVRPDGRIVWATMHATPVRRADGSIQGFFSQIVDITERKRREARLGRYINDAVWLGRIRGALDDDDLLLYWQPIVDLRTGKAVQRELLIRMRAEDGTIIAPGEFLPVAERYGLIFEIDRWVIWQAAHAAADGTPTQFNLSTASIREASVLDELARAIKTTNVDPSLLVVEITETAIMDQPHLARRFAEQVRTLGCGLALDDFGTGFASLSYLKHVPAEQLKIDIEFVRELTRNKTDERVVRGIVGIAREFEQITTAEGIEDEATLALLRELGVDRGQGYLFGRPEPLHADGAAATQPPCSSPLGCTDPVAIVRSLFKALAARDLAACQRLCHPHIVLRPFATAGDAHRDTLYRGRGGMRSYLHDVATVWDELELTPTAFWETGMTVVAFGRAAGKVGARNEAVDALWVIRLREGLIASVDVFLNPPETEPSGVPTVLERRAAAGPGAQAG